mmetsp:Transcript_11022/g.17387  ORF Transcript_11022/g.17387 Transcript_11022/m.17387 type:complete len:80 (-) Transcript_11022:26-265(-)
MFVPGADHGFIDPVGIIDWWGHLGLQDGFRLSFIAGLDFLILSQRIGQRSLRSVVRILVDILSRKNELDCLAPDPDNRP